jgi:hypothetical protein
LRLRLRSLPATRPRTMASMSSYLMCDDVQAEIARLGQKGIACSAVSDQGWGLLCTLRLPGGGDLGLYQPRHITAHAAGA